MVHCMPAVISFSSFSITHEMPPLTAPLLSAAELQQFHASGYLILPGILPPERAADVRADIDSLMLQFDTTQGTLRQQGSSVQPSRPNRRGVAIGAQPSLGALTVFPPVVQRVKELMASHPAGEATFSFHHQHASRLDAGAVSADWHHDCEKQPPRPHRHIPGRLTAQFVGLQVD